MGLLDKALSFVEALSRYFAGVAAMVYVAILFGAGIDALSRTIFDRPLRGVVDFGESLLVILVFMGLAHTQMIGGHVGSGAVMDRVRSARMKRNLLAFGLVGVAAIMLWLGLASLESAMESWRINEYRFGRVRVPLWPARWAVAVGLLALVAQMLAQATGIVLGLRQVRFNDEEALKY